MVLQLLCISSLLKSHLPPFHEDSPDSSEKMPVSPAATPAHSCRGRGVEKRGESEKLWGRHV